MQFGIWTNTIWYLDKYNWIFGQIHLMLLSSSVWRSARHELQSSIREPSLENFDKSASDFKNPDLQICSNVKVVSHLLLASCWLRCVLLAQFAISVSASLRIRSDFVLDECALESEKGSKISDGSSTNGRCRGIGSFRDYPHSWYDQRTIRDILPLYPLQKPCFVGKPSLELAESNPPYGVCKLLKDCVPIAIFNIPPLYGCKKNYFLYPLVKTNIMIWEDSYLW